MKRRTIILLALLIALICTNGMADNAGSLPDGVKQILAGDNWKNYTIGRTNYGDSLNDYGTDACSYYDQYGNSAALVLLHSDERNTLCLFEKNNSGEWALKSTFNDVVKQGNAIPLITCETYGSFLISYLDNDTNESSGITISKEGKTWIVKNVNRRDSASNYVQGNAKLVLGDKGEAVTLLQRALTNLGFSTQGIDGSFGKKTMTAVKAFQKKYGLTVDGIAGPKTQNKLYSLVDSQSPDSAPSDPAPTSPPDTGDITKRTDLKLVYGDSGDQVSIMQKTLAQLGFYTKSIDGNFGQGTLSAVKTFQRKYGLTADGKAGPKTLNKLYAIADGHQSQDSILPSSDSSPRTDIKLVFGNQGEQVYFLQEALTKVGFSIKCDGKFGTATLKAVQDFQAKYDLTVDGKAGPITLTLLYSLSNGK